MNLIQENIWIKGGDIWNRLQGKKIFITGGTGFFGRSILELITEFNKEKELNLKITILTRDSISFKKKWPNLSDERWVDFVDGDVENFAFPELKYDYLLHMATPASASLNIEKPIRMFDIIVNGTRNILEFAAKSKVKSVLLTSSGAVYGRQSLGVSHNSETNLCAPHTQDVKAAYGEAKRVAELLGKMYSGMYDFEFKIARCYAFVGPHLDANGTFAIGNFIRDCVNGKKIEVNGDGTSKRSYLNSDDLVLWLFKILINGKNCTPYNVGSDEGLSIKELAEKIANVLKSQAGVVIKERSALGAAIDIYVPSIELAKKELGLNVWTSLEDSIIQTAAAYKNAN